MCPAVAQDLEGIWVLTDIKQGEIDKNDDNPSYPVHEITVSGTTVTGMLKWCDNGDCSENCGGTVYATSSWTEPPSTLKPGSFLNITLHGEISGDQSCGNRFVGVSTAMHINNNVLAWPIIYWATKDPTPPPFSQVASYRMPTGHSEGQKLNVQMLGKLDLIGSVQVEYTYSWQKDSEQSLEQEPKQPTAVADQHMTPVKSPADLSDDRAFDDEDDVKGFVRADLSWQKANGGWLVIRNTHVYNTNGPFLPCPGQKGCRGYPIHVEHGVCINAVTFDNSSIGASWNLPDNNIILAKDCGTNDWMSVDCPVVTKHWVPAGTYTITEFTYVSEVNPGDTSYSPCHNAWSKPSKKFIIKPGDMIDFGESTFAGEGACTVGGYPSPGAIKFAGKDSPLNHPPTVDLQFSPKRPTSADSIMLTAQAEDPDGDGLTYEWFLGNIETIIKSGSDKDMQLQLEPGDYQYSVLVSDEKGGTSRDVVRFTVRAK